MALIFTDFPTGSGSQACAFLTENFLASVKIPPLTSMVSVLSHQLEYHVEMNFTLVVGCCLMLLSGGSRGVLVLLKFCKIMWHARFLEEFVRSFFMQPLHWNCLFRLDFLWCLHAQFSGAKHNFSKTSTPLGCFCYFLQESFSSVHHLA